MKTVKIELTIDVDDDFTDELKSTVGHHIERLIDLESFPEIKQVYHCKYIEDGES